MKNSVLTLFLASATFSLTITFAQAQTNPALSLTAEVAIPELVAPQSGFDPAKTSKAIRVRNVPIDMMVWWLDPDHQEVPVLVQMSRKNAQGLLPDSSQDAFHKVNLDGIDRLVVIKPHNTLIVSGSLEATARIEKTVEALDKPLQQVEVEVRYFQVGSAEMKSLDLVPLPKMLNSGPFVQAKVPTNIESRILNLLQKNRIKLVTAPHVTAINHLTAASTRTEGRSAAVGVNLDGKIQEIPGIPFKAMSEELLVGIGTGFTVTPTIREGETVDMLLVPGRLLILGGKDFGQPLWRKNLDGVQFLPHINNGETVALLGANPHLFDGLQPTEEKPSDILILVTSRIIRRARDEGLTR